MVTEPTDLQLLIRASTLDGRDRFKPAGAAESEALALPQPGDYRIGDGSGRRGLGPEHLQPLQRLHQRGQHMAAARAHADVLLHPSPIVFRKIVIQIIR